MIKYQFCMEFKEDIKRVNVYVEDTENTYADFVVKYNSMDDYGSVFEYYRRQGLRLKDDMPFNIN